MNVIPQALAQYHDLMFTALGNTTFLIEAAESDTSQLTLTEHGTTLDASIAPTFELCVYEVDSTGYKGLSGQFKSIDEIEVYYDVDLKAVIPSMHFNQSFMNINEVFGIFVDSVLTDEADNLIFISLWGRDTAIRELQGRLTLGVAEGGLTHLNLRNDDTKAFVQIGNINAMEQMTGRVHTDILGELVHCFIFHKEIMKPDLANHRAILIAHEGEPSFLWNAVKYACPVPLLDHWESVLLPLLKNAGMIKPLSGINQSGTKITIDEEQMALLVKQECLNGRLSVTP
jgi:hypothetical protein